jgi:hypothetical protein
MLHSIRVAQASSTQNSVFFHRSWAWWFTLAVLVFVAAVRFRLRDFPIERDEGEYAYAGQLMLQGIPPYQLAYNMKFPGTYAAYAVLMALFGQSPAGIHLGLICLTTATALMLYWLGRQMFNPVAGMVAATSYAIYSANPNLLGLSGHATHFAAFFVTAGFCALWKCREDQHWKWIVSAGFLFGTAVLMKQHAAFIAFWAAATFSAMKFRQTGGPVGKVLPAIIVFGLAVILPCLLCSALLWRAGVFAKFWFWTIAYAREYVSITSFSRGRTLFDVMVPWIVSRSLCVWLLAALGLVLMWFDKRLLSARIWLLGFSVASVLTVFPGFYFRPHYFLLVLPAAALLAGCAVFEISRFWQMKTGGTRFSQLPVFAYAILLTAVVFANRGIWLIKTPVQAASAIYGSEPFPEAQTVAAFIRTNSAPDSFMAVLGSEPEIYFLAGRHSATGYIYTFGLMERQSFARQMEAEMIREIEAHPPEFIVCANYFTTWMQNASPRPKISDWWNAYQTNYTQVGLANVVSPAENRHGTDTNAIDKPEFGGLEVFQRNHQQTNSAH